MRKKALRKDFYMEIRKSFGRFLSIFFIVAIGTAFFSGIRAAEPDMRLSGDAYFDKSKLMDLQVISTMGLTADDLQAIREIKGVEQAQPVYSMDALCDVDGSQKVVHIFSSQDGINELKAEKGRMPEKADECVADADFLASSGYQIGDKITFLKDEDTEVTEELTQSTFQIVGSVSSPEYISFSRGSSMIGNGSVSGFISVLPESFQMDAYTEISIQVKGAKEETAFTKEYDNLVDETKKKVEAIQSEREDIRREELMQQMDQKQAVEMLHRYYEIERWVKTLKEERENLEAEFAALPCTVKMFPSHANFFLARVTDAAKIYNYLVGKGIIVRNRNSVSLCGNCLRVTVGTRGENEKLIEALKVFTI